MLGLSSHDLSAMRELGEGFDVRTADSTAALGDPELGRFDLIVPIATDHVAMT
jgi:hypothetical protein